MSLIEKLDSVLAKWRAREQRAEEQAMNSEQDYGNQSWYGGVSEAAGDCADELDALMPAIRQALLDSERLADLEAHVMETGGLILHNGDFRGDYAGLGLANTGRTLRKAIDQMVGRATGEGEGHD